MAKTGKDKAQRRTMARASAIVKPRDILVLKTLALLGGTEDYVVMSSRELGDRLLTTQQTASLRILDLLKRGYLTRRVGARKQGLMLTPKGIEVLRHEHSDYMRIFEFTKELEVRGEVFSGIGEGKYYISQADYKRQFKEKLWFVPFPGTLNVKLAGGELSKMNILREAPGIEIEGFNKEGRTFGPGKCFLATINNEDCAIIIPRRTHYNNVLEVISKDYLREKLGLSDGDTVELHISI
jgi:riboflavin kinase